MTVAKITEVDFTNAQDSSEILDGEYSPESVDFEQVWRIHLLDMIAPYCEHDKGLLEKSDMGRNASLVWRSIMTECKKWEVEQGL